MTTREAIVGLELFAARFFQFYPTASLPWMIFAEKPGEPWQCVRTERPDDEIRDPMEVVDVWFSRLSDEGAVVVGLVGSVWAAPKARADRRAPNALPPDDRQEGVFAIAASPTELVRVLRKLVRDPISRAATLGPVLQSSTKMARPVT